MKVKVGFSEDYMDQYEQYFFSTIFQDSKENNLTLYIHIYIIHISAI